MQSFPPDVSLQLLFFSCFLTYLASFLFVFISVPFSFCLILLVFAYPLFSFFIPSVSLLDMLATYSIIQDLIKCDIKKVTLRNEQLLSVKRIPTSILLQGSIPAMERKKNLAVVLYKLCCCVSNILLQNTLGGLPSHMNFNGIPFSICRVKYRVGPPFSASNHTRRLSTRFTSEFTGICFQ